MKISTFGISDKGKSRSENEDSFFLDDARRIYAVADGLGGLPEGALASRLAIKHLEKTVNGSDFHDRLDFEKVFNAINGIVFKEGRKVDPEIGIGSTFTVLRVEEDSIAIGHVGDCVVFLFRDREWAQITTDHTMAAEIRARLEPGEEAYIPDYFSHTLTRCLGQQGSIKVDVYTHAVQRGDRILICSDGVTKTQSEEELLDMVEKTGSPEAFVRAIIDLANDRGGPDNATGIALFLD